MRGRRNMKRVSLSFWRVEVSLEADDIDSKVKFGVITFRVVGDIFIHGEVVEIPKLIG